MKVKLDTKEIEVNKLPIGRYSELLKLIREFLPRLDIDSLSKTSNKDMLKMIPDLIADNLPEAIKLINIGSGLPEEEIAGLGLAECIDIIMAIFEVNKYTEVWDKIKKGLARLPKANTLPKTIG